MNKHDSAKEMETRISALQRRLRAGGIPLLLMFEGPSAAGRGRLISKLINLFDSRGYRLVTSSVLSESADKRIPMQKFWINTPGKGRIAIFERTPYGELVERAMEGRSIKRQLSHVMDFERTLAADGALVLKIFLDISAKEQRRRLKKLDRNKCSSWRVTDDDWRQNRRFEKYQGRMERIMSASDTEFAPWLRLDCGDLKEAKGALFGMVAGFIEERLGGAKPSATVPPPSPASRIPDSPTDRIDLSLSLSREEYERRLEELQEELLDLELKSYRKRLPVIIAFEGCDAAGKGGAIKRLTQGLDPRGFEVIPVAAPDETERRHHYLWRFWRSFPKKGHFAIFDRTWYGRVLVERVEGFCSENDWRRAYDEINAMEECLSDSGAVLCKFWLHISQEEQLRRFNDRKNSEWKSWKLSDEDWRNREKWPQYKKAVDEMLVRTSTEHAPWTIVEAECKLYSRIKVLSTVIESLKRKGA